MIGEINHGHFSMNSPELCQELIDEAVSEDVLAFIEELFADRVLLSKSSDGHRSGWQLIDPGTGLEPNGIDEYFLWSGPIST